MEKRQKKYGSIFKTRIFGADSIAIVKAEANRFILTNNQYFAVSWPQSTKIILGSNLTYLEMVSKEVLRIVPPVGGGFRKVVKSCEYNGYYIPEGWNVLYQIGRTHADEFIYYQPDKNNHLPAIIERLLIMIRNINLNRKFTLVLSIVFIIGVLLSGVAFANILDRNAENEVAAQAQLLMQTMIAVRNYTSKQINPLLAPQLETSPQFIPQTVPNYSAIKVFENLQTDSQYKNFIYREATLNPTNLRDKADSFETKLIENLQKNSRLNELRDYRQIGNEKLYYIAKPLIVSEASCLRCHSTTNVAPKSLIATYGSKNGFGWKLNEIVGVQVIFVPSSQIKQAAWNAFKLVMIIVISAFGIAILITNILLKKVVIRPLKRIVNVANEVSTGNMEAEFEHSSNDEIGMLATAFNRMKISLAMAMDILQGRNKN